jgi:hypothetical protein
MAEYFLGEVYHGKGPDFFPQSCASLRRATAANGPPVLDAHMLQFANELMRSVCK